MIDKIYPVNLSYSLSLAIVPVVISEPEEALDLGKQLGLLEVSEVFEAELLLDEGYVEGEKLGDVTEDGHGLLG